MARRLFAPQPPGPEPRQPAARVLSLGGGPAFDDVALRLVTAFLRACADAGEGGASLIETAAVPPRNLQASTVASSGATHASAPAPAPSLPWRPRLVETTVYDLFDEDWGPAVSAVSDGIETAVVEGLLSSGRRADLQVSSGVAGSQLLLLFFFFFWRSHCLL